MYYIKCIPWQQWDFHFWQFDFILNLTGKYASQLFQVCGLPHTLSSHWTITWSVNVSVSEEDRDVQYYKPYEHSCVLFHDTRFLTLHLRRYISLFPVKWILISLTDTTTALSIKAYFLIILALNLKENNHIRTHTFLRLGVCDGWTS